VKPVTGPGIVPSRPAHPIAPLTAEDLGIYEFSAPSYENNEAPTGQSSEQVTNETATSSVVVEDDFGDIVDEIL